MHFIRVTRRRLLACVSFCFLPKNAFDTATKNPGKEEAWVCFEVLNLNCLRYKSKDPINKIVTVSLYYIILT